MDNILLNHIDKVKLENMDTTNYKVHKLIHPRDKRTYTQIQYYPKSYNNSNAKKLINNAFNISQSPNSDNNIKKYMTSLKIKNDVVPLLTNGINNIELINHQHATKYSTFNFVPYFNQYKPTHIILDNSINKLNTYNNHNHNPQIIDNNKLYNTIMEDIYYLNHQPNNISIDLDSNYIQSIKHS